MGKAQNIINSCVCTIRDTLGELENAKCNCEKQENKSKIQSAIDSINSACNELHDYKD